MRNLIRKILNESDDLEWARDIVKGNTFTLKSLIDNDILHIGDEVWIYGDIHSLNEWSDDPDDERTRLLFTLNGEKFKVSEIKVGSNIIKFTWLTPDGERPKNWGEATSGNMIVVDEDTWEFDKNLDIKIIPTRYTITPNI